MPKLGLGPAFIGSDLFILTSLVVSSIIMEVIHMYVSIAIKLSKYLTGLLCTLYQQLIKANVNSFMCDALLMEVILVHEKFNHPCALMRPEVCRCIRMDVSCVRMDNTALRLIKYL